MDHLRTLIEAWREGDPDPETCAELDALLEAGDDAALRERFATPLEFGTAGLRGIVGAGPARMNRAVVIRTTRALAEYLEARVPDADALAVVVGRDARLSSQTFFDDVVRVLARAGIPVRYFDDPVPTPLVAFAAKELAASAAVIITASHNPPEYNGYKLYGSSAVQIVPPVDQEIAARIEKMGPARAVPGALASPLEPSSAIGADRGLAHDSAIGVDRSLAPDSAIGVDRGLARDSAIGVDRGLAHDSAIGAERGLAHASDATSGHGLARASGADAVSTGRRPSVEAISVAMGERYLACTSLVRREGPSDRSLPIVYTPLHGVGGAWVEALLARAGYHHVLAVPEQRKPDGRFPTVRFPNPEEPGALDRAIDLALRTNAELVLANDPDADRLGAAVRTPSGRFLTLTGNQIGLLLLDWALDGGPFRSTPLVVSSIVSSPLARKVAQARGARHEWTLTGFKWIWTAALELEKSEGVEFVFGYEEALGYSVGPWVRDKDGISAALAFAELAARARAQGQTVLERLGAIYRTYGLYSSAQVNVVRQGSQGARELNSAVERCARNPPDSLGGERVLAVTDYRTGAEKRPPWLGSTPLVELRLEGGGRLLVRPSGTEPKLKIYADLPGSVPPNGSFMDSDRNLVTKASSVGRELARLLGLE
jgi:phosphomannomutase